MENLLNKKVELSLVPLREGYTHCDICGGISWLLHKDNYIVKCMCNDGLVKICSECGVPMEANRYSCRNSDCEDKIYQFREDIRIQKAMQLDINDKLVKQSGMLYSYVHDGCKEGYFDSIDDYLDTLASNDIELNEHNNTLWLCGENKFDIDIDSVLENELHDHYEDAYHNLSDIEELREFVDKWCEKQDITTYHSEDKYYIRVAKDKNI